jgi:hypothetical protein
MARGTWFAVAAAVGAAVEGCGAPPAGCTPGETQACACPGGASGVQTCSASGTAFGACTGCPSGRACGSRVCGSDGAGGSCGTCADAYRCTGEGTCELDPSREWVITVTSGTVATTMGGAEWDAFGGAPDPEVCLTLGTQRLCTPEATDTFTPVWNTAMGPATAGVLEAGIFVEYFDVDVTTNDEICGSATVVITPGNFMVGGGSVGCGATGNFNYTVTPR